MREFEFNRYKDDETVRNLVDAFMIVNRHIESETDHESTEKELEFRKKFSDYSSKEIERIAPKFWETISQDQ
jgi:hypothetical protein